MLPLGGNRLSHSPTGKPVGVANPYSISEFQNRLARLADNLLFPCKYGMIC